MTPLHQQMTKLPSFLTATFFSITIFALLPIPTALAELGMNETAQITLSGVRGVVKGEIVEIDGENYWIRRSPNKTVRLHVTQNTDMVCDNQSPEQQTKVHPLGASIDMSNQPESVGFRIGNCPPSVGDTVKAEVTSLGTVSYLHVIAPEEVRSLTERLGLPQHY